MMSTRTLQHIHTTTQEVDSSFNEAATHATRQTTGAPGICGKTPGGTSSSLEQPHEVILSLDDKITVVVSRNMAWTPLP